MSQIIPDPVPALPPEEPAPSLPSSDYWSQSRQPLTSLVFIAPLLVIYEAGVLLPSGAARNGVDVWLRTLLDWIGFGQYFLLPFLTVCILLAWHYTTRQPWRVSPRVLGRMAVECVVLSICLRAILELQFSLLHQLVAPASMTINHAAVLPAISERLGSLVMFLGAGIYEELLFRLILLSGAIWCLRRFEVPPPWCTVHAIVLTSILFAAAHHIGPHGEPFDLFSFLFRFVAGVFFCVLFVYRGFGIAAGTHAGYDILVGLLPR